MNLIRNLAIAAILLGILGIIVGVAFIGLGAARNFELKEAMRVEHVTLGIEGEETNQVIDSLNESKSAGDTIREHRRGIAPTYEELLGGERYNPTNPQQLTYAQALNLENYLYLAVVAFGLTQAVMGTGAFMILTGLAIGGTGIALYQVQRRLT
jgi:hypothetical protein